MKQFGFLKFVAIGLGIVAIVLGITLLINQGSHVDLKGRILKTRLIKTDDNSTVVLLDFRFENPAKYPFLVREIKITAVTADGASVTGDSVAQMDLDRLLDYYKFAGPRYNPMLMVRDRIKPKESMDRTAAASFQVSEAKLAGRKSLALSIEDSDGNIAQIVEGVSQ